MHHVSWWPGYAICWVNVVLIDGVAHWCVIAGQAMVAYVCACARVCVRVCLILALETWKKSQRPRELMWCHIFLTSVLQATWLLCWHQVNIVWINDDPSECNLLKSTTDIIFYSLFTSTRLVAVILLEYWYKMQECCCRDNSKAGGNYITNQSNIHILDMDIWLISNVVTASLISTYIVYNKIIQYLFI